MSSNKLAFEDAGEHLAEYNRSIIVIGHQKVRVTTPDIAASGYTESSTSRGLVTMNKLPLLRNLDLLLICNAIFCDFNLSNRLLTCS